MLNKIMMTGRITANLNVVTEDNYSYCKFSIAVDQPKRNGIKATPHRDCGADAGKDASRCAVKPSGNLCAVLPIAFYSLTCGM